MKEIFSNEVCAVSIDLFSTLQKLVMESLLWRHKGQLTYVKHSQPYLFIQLQLQPDLKQF
jgi:hypothetical protein